MLQVRKVVTAGVGAALALTVASGVTTANAKAAPQKRLLLQSGTTSLAVAPNTAKALAANGIKVTTAAEGRVTDRGQSFPITGGTLDAKTLAGEVNHVGGLVFTSKKAHLTVRDFKASTSARKLSGYVDQLKTRIVILDLNLSKIKVSNNGKTVRILNIGATLDKNAAAGLNAVFDTKLFKGGLPIGTARVDANYIPITVG